MRIPPDGVDRVAPVFLATIAPALRLTRNMGPRELHALARAGRCQWWLVWDPEGSGRALAALVTEILDYPARRVARVLLTAGHELARWRHLIGKVESWARDEGCRAVEIVGRPGWGRVFPDYGFEASTFTREL